MRQNYVNSTRCLLIGIMLVVAAPGAGAQPGAPELKLPVPRTFDLTHVEAKHYAVALGKDPAKIFEFVRDQIGYEVYTGALRGPRGTLLAMAGNSVDRAALLASLLKESGHRVQFVRGTLPKAEAKKLVDSMWVERLRPTPPRVTEPPPAMKAALDTLVAGVKRDYTLIRDHLKKANITPSSQSVPSLDSLVQEAQEHYWVQWWKDSGWVDVDPSFAEATPGRKYATVAEILDPLPEKLFHQVSIRIQLEEYEVSLTGNAEGKPSTRTILTYTAKAADLSGKDVVLTHQPENWKEPANSLESAISSAIGNTGRVKPALIIGQEKWVAGEPFRQKPPTGGGISGVFTGLSGEGTRKPVTIATAEYLQFDFIAPGGRKETVVREVFDVVGKARRRAGRNLNENEVRGRTEAKTAVDVTEGIYGLFFTTGHIDSAHLSNLVEDLPATERDPPDIPVFLRSINVAFAAASDSLLGRLSKPDRATILFYPDSPRLLIADVLVPSSGKLRILLDLRRSHTRGVAMGPHPEDIFVAQVIRGVVEGTLERSLIEFVTAEARENALVGSVMSTSSLMEQAQANGVPTVRLSRDAGGPGAEVPEEARARVREELENGFLVVAPEKGIHVDEMIRFAWWRIDPRSGETIAVTDEGLHATAVCYSVEKRQGERRVTVTYKYEKKVGDAVVTRNKDFVHVFSRNQGRQYRDFLRSMKDQLVPRMEWPG